MMPAAAAAANSTNANSPPCASASPSLRALGAAAFTDDIAAPGAAQLKPAEAEEAKALESKVSVNDIIVKAAAIALKR